MNNKLSINSLALSNLRVRRRQYLSLTLGIMMAVFFVSTILLAGQSIFHSAEYRYRQRVGLQDAILMGPGSAGPRELMDTGLFDRVGSAHVIGLEEKAGFAIGYYDDTAEALLARRLVEGRMPRAASEIAMEYGALSQMRADTKVGQSLTIGIKAVAFDQYLPDIEHKVYTLVGILAPQVDYQETNWMRGPNAMQNMPQALVAQGEQPGPGGGEVIHRIVTYKPGVTDDQLTRWGYQTGDYREVKPYSYSLLRGGQGGEFDQHELLRLVVFMGALLILAAGVSIANAFGGMLAERRQQIGMMRAVGATVKQVRALFVREGLILALVTAPVSVGLSYAAVRVLTHFTKGSIDFYAAPWFLPAALVMALSVVCLSALMPLRGRAWASPMQAIRETTLLREKRRVREKPRAHFDVARLMALRHLRLYRSSRMGVSLLIMLSFLMMTAIYASTFDLPADDSGIAYSVSADAPFNAHAYVDVNEKYYYHDVDRRDIEALPLVASVTGRHVYTVLLEREKISPYVSIPGNGMNEHFRMDMAGDRMTQAFGEWYERDREDYQKLLADQELEGPVMVSSLVAVDDDLIEALRPYLCAGDIVPSAIHAGREVLVYAPSEYYVREVIEWSEGYSSASRDLDTEPQPGISYDQIIKNDQFAIGDRLRFTHLMEDAEKEEGDYIREKSNREGVVRQDAEASVGGLLVTQGRGRNTYSDLVGYSAAGTLITSRSGLKAMGLRDLGYTSIGVKLSEPPDEETHQYHRQELEQIAARVDRGRFTDSLQAYADSYQWVVTLVISISAVVFLFFVLSLSLVNNAMTNRVKSEKRAIGTLRAVGAQMKDVLRSYRMQAWIMIGEGALPGLAISALWWIIQITGNNGRRLPAFPALLFTGFAAFLLAMGILTALSLNAQLRQITCASIVENIREL